MLPVSAVPVNVGVGLLVILSVFEHPLSVAAVKSGVEGTAGATVSTTRFLFAPSEPVAPGEGKVKAALLPVWSLMVAPLRVSALVEV